MKEIKLSVEYLDEICKFSGRKIVGVLMKRIDLVNDKSTLKAITKELVYEQIREIKNHILAFNEGRETEFYNFKTE